jgi:hypothetical protein
MKFIAILAAFIVTFVGSSCATNTDEKHGRKLGKNKNKKKKAGKKNTYISALSAAQRVDDCTANYPGLGSALLTLDEDTLCVMLTYSVMNNTATGHTATGVHIHGPAMIGQAGDKLFTFPTETTPNRNACFDLNKEEKKYLDSGLLYFNVHTLNTCPLGEIRGQIFAQS